MSYQFASIVPAPRVPTFGLPTHASALIQAPTMFAGNTGWLPGTAPSLGTLVETGATGAGRDPEAQPIAEFNPFLTLKFGSIPAYLTIGVLAVLVGGAINALGGGGRDHVLRSHPTAASTWVRVPVQRRWTRDPGLVHAHGALVHWTKRAAEHHPTCARYNALTDCGCFFVLGWYVSGRLDRGHGHEQEASRLPPACVPRANRRSRLLCRDARGVRRAR